MQEFILAIDDKILLIINGLVFLAQNTPITGTILNNYFSLFPYDSGYFYPWQLVSYMFMHGNISHIFFNLFASSLLLLSSGLALAAPL